MTLIKRDALQISQFLYRRETIYSAHCLLRSLCLKNGNYTIKLYDYPTDKFTELDK